MCLIFYLHFIIIYVWDFIQTFIISNNNNNNNHFANHLFSIIFIHLDFHKEVQLLEYYDVDFTNCDNHPSSLLSLFGSCQLFSRLSSAKTPMWRMKSEEWSGEEVKSVHFQWTSAPCSASSCLPFHSVCLLLQFLSFLSLTLLVASHFLIVDFMQSDWWNSISYLHSVTRQILRHWHILSLTTYINLL